MWYKEIKADLEDKRKAILYWFYIHGQKILSNEMNSSNDLKKGRRPYRYLGEIFFFDNKKAEINRACMYGTYILSDMGYP